MRRAGGYLGSAGRRHRPAGCLAWPWRPGEPAAIGLQLVERDGGLLPVRLQPGVQGAELDLSRLHASARRRKSTSIGRGSGNVIGASDQSCGSTGAGVRPRAAGCFTRRGQIQASRPRADRHLALDGGAGQVRGDPAAALGPTRKPRSSIATRLAVRSTRLLATGAGCRRAAAVAARAMRAARAARSGRSRRALGGGCRRIDRAVKPDRAAGRPMAAIGLGSPAATPCGRATLPARVARLPPSSPRRRSSPAGRHPPD